MKACGAFFVLALNDDQPAGCPFGAIMEAEGELFLFTNDMNQAYKQLRTNGRMQIVAKKLDSREWIRITGTASECSDERLRQRMLAECPVLSTGLTPLEWSISLCSG